MTTLALAPRFSHSVRLPSAASVLDQLAAVIRSPVRTTSALRQYLVDNTVSALIAGFEDAAGQHDGDAMAPNPAALGQAKELIESLPMTTAAPTPLFETSGAIALQWDVGPHRFFVVAFDGSGHIEYSAILGPGDEHFGKAPFKGRLPDQAVALLTELLPA